MIRSALTMFAVVAGVSLASCSRGRGERITEERTGPQNPRAFRRCGERRSETVGEIFRAGQHVLRRREGA